MPRHWRFPPASGGHPPRLLPLSGGLLPGAWGRRYFWPCRTRVGLGSATGPTLKTALYHIRALVGRIDKYQRSTRTLLGVCEWPFLSSSWVAFGRPSYLWAVLSGVPRHWRFPPASGGYPPRLLPPSAGLGLLPGAWGAPKRGMPTGSKVFFALPDACGPRPCDRAHLKNGLVPYSCVGGTHR